MINKHFKTPLKSVYSFFIVIYNKNMNEESKEKLKLLQVVMSLKRKLGFCYSDIPSLRFGTDFASPYNLLHGLLLKYSKLKINKKIIHIKFHKEY
ncbi:MAG: hypothetical protein PUJ82_05130 [Spirochaetales bacterium]|nr:hypothetical protein [Spirochaetales bacterium]